MLNAFLGIGQICHVHYMNPHILLLTTTPGQEFLRVFSTRPKYTKTVILRPRDSNPGPAEDVPSYSPLHQDPLLCFAQYTSQRI